MLLQNSPELQKTLRDIQKQLERSLKQFEQVMETWRLDLDRPFKQLRESPDFRRWRSAEECSTLIHPIYFKLFEPEFSADEVKQNWRKVRSMLWRRFPENLDKDSRRERYNQILKCQTIRAYTPVCRAIYAELEALLRDELLFADPNWKAKWEDKESPDSKKGFQTEQFSKLVKNQHPDIKLVDEGLTLSEVGGIATYTFLLHLEKAFEKFDPAKVDHKETKSFRHIHAHGWAKEASFMDGLNGILAFDLALEIVSNAVEERDRSVS